jgi:hypothetical protein
VHTNGLLRRQATPHNNSLQAQRSQYIRTDTIRTDPSLNITPRWPPCSNARTLPAALKMPQRGAALPSAGPLVSPSSMDRTLELSPRLVMLRGESTSE